MALLLATERKGQYLVLVNDGENIPVPGKDT